MKLSRASLAGAKPSKRRLVIRRELTPERLLGLIADKLEVGLVNGRERVSEIVALGQLLRLYGHGRQTPRTLDLIKRADVVAQLSKGRTS